MNTHISDFITYHEYECRCCHKLPPDFYYNGGGRVDSPPYIYRELFGGFKRLREKWGRPINITSGYRCLKRQKELYEQGISSNLISVHSFGLSLDLDCDSKEEVESMAILARRILPAFRIGHEAYINRGQTFIHLDIGYRISPSYSKKLVEGVSW